MRKPLSKQSNRELREGLARSAQDVNYSYGDYDSELLNRRKTRLMVAAILVNAALVAVDIIIRVVQA